MPVFYLVTYVYQVAFPGGSGRFDFPGAAAMSLLWYPVTCDFFYLYFTKPEEMVHPMRKLSRLLYFAGRLLSVFIPLLGCFFLF